MSIKLLCISLIIASSTLFTSCKNEKQGSSVTVSSIKVAPADTTEWQGHRRVNYKGKNREGKPVQFHLYSPANATGKTPLLIAIHGATSNKAEWGVVGGYTKGGDLTKSLLEEGYSVITVDLAYHGEHHLNREKWTWENGEAYDSIFDNHWESFHAQSLLDIEPAVEFAKMSGRFDTSRTGIASYSLGGYFINQVALLHGSVKSLTYMVPGASLWPEYSAVKNQEGLLETNVYVVAGKADEYIPFKETEQFFDGLKMSNKTFMPYESGHSLPIDYVAPLAGWLLKNL